MFCRHCGTQGDDRFCVNCGRPMEELPEVRPPAEEAVHHPSDVGAYDVQCTVLQRQPAGAVAHVSASAPSFPTQADSTNVTVNVAGPQIVYQDKTGS